MGYVGVSMCDFCGKRTEKFTGTIKLDVDCIRRYKGEESITYKSKKTIRSWRLCKKCTNKLTALETMGDKIKEELELKLDQMRIKNKDFKLLN